MLVAESTVPPSQSKLFVSKKKPYGSLASPRPAKNQRKAQTSNDQQTSDIQCIVVVVVVVIVSSAHPKDNKNKTHFPSLFPCVCRSGTKCTGHHLDP
jgi:hypothetical protein